MSDSEDGDVVSEEGVEDVLNDSGSSESDDGGGELDERCHWNLNGRRGSRMLVVWNNAAGTACAALAAALWTARAHTHRDIEQSR